MEYLIDYDLDSINNTQLRDYAREGFKEIDGWGIDDYLVRIFLNLNNFQSIEKIEGNLVEIGVHHGRSFILLALMRNGSEKAIAIDIFEDQSRNIDNSGSGSRTIFEDYLKQYSIVENVSIIEGDSLFLSNESHKDLQTKARLVHIDGGHYVDAVCSDLALAQSIISPGGIVIVDDYQHSGFPGVNEGCHRYLSYSVPRKLIPIAIGKNKLFLTTHSHHSLLLDFLLGVARKNAKLVELHGYECICVDNH